MACVTAGSYAGKQVEERGCGEDTMAAYWFTGPRRVVGTAVAAAAHQPVYAQDSGQVTIVDFAFEPSTVEVSAVQLASWTNTGEVVHTVTARQRCLQLRRDVSRCHRQRNLQHTRHLHLSLQHPSQHDRHPRRHRSRTAPAASEAAPATTPSAEAEESAAAPTSETQPVIQEEAASAPTASAAPDKAKAKDASEPSHRRRRRSSARWPAWASAPVSPRLHPGHPGRLLGRLPRPGRIILGRSAIRS